MKNYLILLLCFFTLFCYGQKKDKFIDDRKQTIMNFLSSKQEVGVKNSFTNYVQFNIKKYKKLKKKYGDTLIQEYFNLVKRDIKDIQNKIIDEEYYIKHESSVNDKSYNLILNNKNSNYDIFYLFIIPLQIRTTC
jgi:uncharacterized protein (UPF0305 family)